MPLVVVCHAASIRIGASISVLEIGSTQVSESVTQPSTGSPYGGEICPVTSVLSVSRVMRLSAVSTCRVVVVGIH